MMLFNVLTVLYLVAPVALVTCQGSQNQTFIAQEIAKIPPCGLECLTYTAPAVGCSLLNTTCQCESKTLADITAKCMMTNCTLAQSVELGKISAAICERPYESRNRMLRILTIVCCTITNAAVLIRLVTRYCLHQNYRLDDYCLFIAACTDAAFTAIGVQFENHGFGEHVWEIEIDMIPELLYWFYLCEILYVVTIGFIKISLLLFYLQIFPKRSFRIQCWSVMGFVLVCSVAFTIATIFQCHPVSFVWNKDLKHGTCINFNGVTWANGAFNILQDLLIIALPVSEVRKLQLQRKKKIGLYLMFGLGGFVCISSVVRLYTLKTFGLTADPTWDNVPTTIWTTLEVTTAMVCTCLPTIRAGLLRVFPRIFGSTNQQHTTDVSHKGNGGYQASSATFSANKSWPARKLSSISSLSAKDEEARFAGNHSESITIVELSKISSNGFVKR